MIILGLDPGVTTGWAIVSVDDDSEPVMIECGQIVEGHLGFIKNWDALMSYEPNLIVCESFTLREGIKGVNIEPTYVIGALNALTKIDIIYQPPSYKIMCDNIALKHLLMYARGKQHARDAARHIAIYLRTKKHHKPTLKKGWPDNGDTYEF